MPFSYLCFIKSFTNFYRNDFSKNINYVRNVLPIWLLVYIVCLQRNIKLILNFNFNSIKVDAENYEKTDLKKR